jgi:hypothetical protein
MKDILEIEQYVEVSPYEKQSYEYKYNYAKKEAIRTHKWIEAEKGRILSWDDAKEEWTRLYEKAFERGFSRSYTDVGGLGFRRFPLEKTTIGSFTRLEYFLIGAIGLSYILILYMSH